MAQRGGPGTIEDGDAAAAQTRAMKRAAAAAACAAWRRGPNALTFPARARADAGDDDLTMLNVPSEAVGFVTGAQGNFLRSIEEEWGTLMFFADFRGRDRGARPPAR